MQYAGGILLPIVQTLLATIIFFSKGKENANGPRHPLLNIANYI